MSEMGPVQRTGTQRALSNLGQANDVDLALGGSGVTPEMMNRVVTYPILRMRVAAALHGETAPPVTLDDLVAREIALTKQWCELAEVTYPGDKIVQQVLMDADKAWGGLTVNDRFIPGGLWLDETFQAIIGWNARCDEESQLGSKVKLAVKPGEEFWHTDKSVQRLKTEQGVFRCRSPLKEILHPWDAESTPYNLSYDRQDEICREAGGEGLCFAAEMIYFSVRGTLEKPGQPCWSPLVVRVKDFYGSGDSLSVLWDAGGLVVSNWCCRDDACCDLGALPRRLHRV